MREAQPPTPGAGILSSWGKIDHAHSIAADPVDGSLYTVEIRSRRVEKCADR
jgi:hypothetical protein